MRAVLAVMDANVIDFFDIVVNLFKNLNVGLRFGKSRVDKRPAIPPPRGYCARQANRLLFVLCIII